MQILIQKECFYVSSIGADSTEHFKNNLNSVTDVYTLPGTVSKIFSRNLWRQNWMPPSVMKKIHKVDLQTDNKRNGHSPKNLKSQHGEFQIDVPRDRNGEFEPKLIPKYQRTSPELKKR